MQSSSPRAPKKPLISIMQTHHGKLDPKLMLLLRDILTHTVTLQELARDIIHTNQALAGSHQDLASRLHPNIFRKEKVGKAVASSFLKSNYILDRQQKLCVLSAASAKLVDVAAENMNKYLGSLPTQAGTPDLGFDPSLN